MTPTPAPAVLGGMSIPAPSASGARVDGRWIVLAALVGYFALLGMLTLFTGQSDRAWQSLGVPAVQPSFLDLHSVTAAADSQRQGHDPLRDNVCDPLGRTLNYPRLWPTLLLALGVHQSATTALGLGLVGAFYACTFLFLGRISARDGLVWAMLLCAPSTMLAVERGNNDLVIFCLAALALVGLRQAAPVWRVLAYGLLELGAILKLYPICALAVALRKPPRRAALILLTAGTVFALYLLLIRKDLPLIKAATPRPLLFAYGSRVFSDRLASAHMLPHPLAGTVLALLAAAGTAGMARLRWPTVPSLPRAATDGLLVGAAFYTATFTLTNNYVYRLIFLLFAVPALLWMWEGGGVFHRRLAAGLLGAMAVGWYLASFWWRPIFLVKEAADWFVFGGMAFLLLLFLPPGRGDAGRA